MLPIGTLYKLASPTEIYDRPGTEAEVLQRVRRGKTKWRVAKINGLRKRHEQGSASSKVPDASRWLRAHKWAQRIARKSKVVEESVRRWLLSEPLSQASMHRRVSFESKASCQNQTVGEAKSAEWKRRKTEKNYLNRLKSRT